MSVTITKMIVPESKHGIKCPYPMDPIGTTTHETGNKATAMSEVSYMIGNNAEVSFHIAIDDIRAVQGLPFNRNGWHSGDGGSGRGNRETISLEICFNWNGKTTTKNDKILNPLYQKAVKNSVEVQAQLFMQYPKWGVPQNGVNMWRHYDHSKKNCPQRMIEEGYWNTYVALVKTRYLELKGGKTVVNKSSAKNPDKEGRSTAFKVGDKVRLSSTAKQWKGSSGFTLSSFKSEYIVNWLNVDGTIYIKPVGADWGGNVYEDDIELSRNNDIQKDDIIKLRGTGATNWTGGAKLTDGMRIPEYSVRYRKGNKLYIDSGVFRGEIYDWDAVKVK